MHLQRGRVQKLEVTFRLIATTKAILFWEMRTWDDMEMCHRQTKLIKMKILVVVVYLAGGTAICPVYTTRKWEVKETKLEEHVETKTEANKLEKYFRMFCPLLNSSKQPKHDCHK